jgi:hypothetical protein
MRTRVEKLLAAGAFAGLCCAAASPAATGDDGVKKRLKAWGKTGGAGRVMCEANAPGLHQGSEIRTHQALERLKRRTGLTNAR